MTNSGMLMADGWMTIEWYNNNKYNSSIFPIKKTESQKRIQDDKSKRYNKG